MSAPARLRSRLRGVISLGTFVAVVVAVGVSLLYLAWVATIRNSDQIGELSVGTFVVGLACAFASLMLTISMIRAIRGARDGRAMLAALLAGPRWRIGPHDLELLGARALQLAGGRPPRADTVAGQARLRERLREALAHAERISLAARLMRRFSGAPGRGHAVRGAYLHGRVGRGKTWLMDLFFDSLPFAAKQRLHFHRFMQNVHAGLRAHALQSEPLAAVATDLAADARVLCLDELFVSDIADAMLLGGLFGHLIDRGVMLMAMAGWGFLKKIFWIQCWDFNLKVNSVQNRS